MYRGEGVQQALLEDFRRYCSQCASSGGARKHPHQEFIQLDTTNILFICGGAFDGLEKIIKNRVAQKTMGLWCPKSRLKRIFKWADIY